MTWTDPLATAFETGDVLTEANLSTYVLNNLLSLEHPLEAPTTANLDVNTTTTETTLYSVTVPANKMGTNGIVRVQMYGDYVHNNVAADTITVRIKFGGLTSWAQASNLGNAVAATRHPWLLDFFIANKGATNAQELFGSVQTEGADFGPASTGIGAAFVETTSAIFPALASTSGAPTIDTTVNQSLLVSVQWSASSANNSWRRRWARTLIGQN